MVVLLVPTATAPTGEKFDLILVTGNHLLEVILDVTTRRRSFASGSGSFNGRGCSCFVVVVVVVLLVPAATAPTGKELDLILITGNHLFNVIDVTTLSRSGSFSCFVVVVVVVVLFVHVATTCEELDLILVTGNHLLEVILDVTTRRGSFTSGSGSFNGRGCSCFVVVVVMLLVPAATAPTGEELDLILVTGNHLLNVIDVTTLSRSRSFSCFVVVVVVVVLFVHAATTCEELDVIFDVTTVKVTDFPNRGCEGGDNTESDRGQDDIGSVNHYKRVDLNGSERFEL